MGLLFSSVLARRLITIPVLIFATLAITLTLPLWAVLAALLSLLRSTRGALPTLGFILAYLWCETAGIMLAFAIWIRHGRGEKFQDVNFKLQCWWANALKNAAENLFQLTFEVKGAEVLEGLPVIMLLRHASIADSVIPMVYYAIPHQVRLRYVLKRELLLDPCLDVVGNRLPNYFVDRHSIDSIAEREAVASLLDNLRGDEGVLIYPEGTRYTEQKHAYLVEKYSDSTGMLTRLQRWKGLLPPRLGGTLAMLNANPGLDLVFCAHTGFEGSSHFRSLINGSWIRAHIRIFFWRIPHAAVPSEADDQREFLHNQWDRMQAEVARMR